MKMIPTSPAAAPAESAFAAGALVMYENDGAPFIGVVLGWKKQKYQILNNRGREIELQPVRLHRLPEKLPGDLGTLEAKSAFLGAIFEECLAASLQLDLGEVWSFVHDEPGDHSTAALCRAYFGAADLKKHLTLRLALIGDPIYFKRKDDEFVARSADIVAELKKSAETRHKKHALQERVVEFAAARLRDRTAPLADDLLPIIHLLEDIAAGAQHIDNNRHKEAKDLVNLIAERLHLELGGTREQRVIELLEAISHFTPDTNLALIRHRPPGPFNSESIEQARALPTPTISTGEVTRRDFTGVPTVTIDDISTLDMDDAISLDRRGEGFELGIHISDVASLIEADTPLDREGRRRATSIYCPDKTIHMFPDEISTAACSLVAGKARAALSCVVTIDRNFNITSAEIVPSLITVTERLTYDDVDARLEHGGDDFLHTLYNIASTLEAERIEKGAIKIQKREVLIGPGEGGRLKLTEIDENAPGRALVGEMMVLANSLMADYAARRSIPCIFRGQPPPDENNRRSAPIPEGPAADYAIRARLKKSTTSFSPERHASLALDAYIQSTSPIRRYADLVNQRQILHHVKTGSVRYSREMLSDVLDSIEPALSEAQAITKETRRFWALRYMQTVSEARRTIKATVLRTDLKNPLVEVDEIHVPFLAKIAFPVSPGDVVSLRVGAVDPRFDHIRLEAVKE